MALLVKGDVVSHVRLAGRHVSFFLDAAYLYKRVDFLFTLGPNWFVFRSFQSLIFNTYIYNFEVNLEVVDYFSGGNT